MSDDNGDRNDPEASLPDLQEIALRCADLHDEALEMEIERLLGEHKQLIPKVRRLARSLALSKAVVPDIAVHARIGPYTFRERLGAGSYGAVWHVYNNELRCHSALKVFHPTVSSQAVEAVQREIQRMRNVYSESIATAYSTSRLANGSVCLDMQLCADPAPESGGPAVGRSLSKDKAARETPLEAARILEIVARAVDSAHQTGVVHGDIKPENIVITPTRRRPIVVDFGLTSVLAKSSEGIGTPGYMPPEQKAGYSPTPVSDVHMLGGTLFNLLTGQLPDVADRPKYLAKVPSTLAKVVLKALAEQPSDRYPTADSLAEDLAAFRANRVASVDANLSRRITLFYLRNRALVSAVAVAIVIATAATGLLLTEAGKQALAEVVAKANRLTMERDLARADVKDLLRQVGALNGALAGSKNETKNAMNTVDQLESHKQLSKSDAAKLRRSLSSLKDQFGTAEVTFAALTLKLQTTTETLGSTSQDLQTAKEKLKETAEALTTKTNELKETADALTTKTNELKETAGALTTKTSELETALTNLQNIKDEVASARDELEIANATIEKLRASQPAPPPTAVDAETNSEQPSASN